ncbi:DUF202 domain-containing protein [Streptomyces sulphureus]|uniref:DUF202 domain-containing protein n=1 Tax=Streptomyces sulphureus TaxID=47758 RepID=UPI00035EF98B|nr:DUF202 domain-containing protein [Streptomyces sulphureus]
MRDPGAQPERTRLAWRRTTLAYAVALALGARTALEGDLSPTAATALACAALAWLALLLAAHRRTRALARAEGPVPMAAGAVRATVACTLVLVVAGALLL